MEEGSEAVAMDSRCDSPNPQPRAVSPSLSTQLCISVQLDEAAVSAAQERMITVIAKLELVQDFLRKKRNDELQLRSDLQKDVKHMTYLIEYVNEAIETIKKG